MSCWVKSGQATHSGRTLHEYEITQIADSNNNIISQLFRRISDGTISVICDVIKMEQIHLI